jgi:hypothetical protein
VTAVTDLLNNDVPLEGARHLASIQAHHEA